MKKLLVALGIVCLLCSCKTPSFYQVYDVASDNVELSDNSFIYQNEDLLLSYYFLAKEGGDFSFYCQNKTDKTIFICLPESFFIRNGIVYDYYKDEYISNGTSTGTSKSHNYQSNKGYSGSKSSSSSIFSQITTHSSATIHIPPHCARIIPGFLIYNYHYLICGEYYTNYPNKHSEKITYTKENTPLEFVNHICYTFNLDNRNEYKYIDNNFYLSAYQNFNERYIRKENELYNRFDECSNQSKYILEIKGANQFYNTYIKQPAPYYQQAIDKDKRRIRIPTNYITK